MLKIPYCNRSGSVYISSKGNFCDTLLSQVPSSASSPNSSQKTETTSSPSSPVASAQTSVGESNLLKANYKLIKRNKKWSTKNRYKYKEVFNIDNSAAGIKQAMFVNAIDKL